MSPHAGSDAYWVGALSMTMACSLGIKDRRLQQSVLRSKLEEFLRSPLEDEKLKTKLREEMKR